MLKIREHYLERPYVRQHGNEWRYNDTSGAEEAAFVLDTFCQCSILMRGRLTLSIPPPPLEAVEEVMSIGYNQ